jgi:hypothetical protein
VNWNKIAVGDWIIVEGFIQLETSSYPKVWTDRMLIRYATALIKKQWGNNMKKFAGMQLPGGITMNGQQIYEEAVTEIKEIEDLIRNTYEEPPQFMIG